MVKPPIDLPMTDSWSGSSCVVGQILYMFGRLNPPISISAIDKRIGRRVNEGTLVGHLKELLRHGFRLTDVREFDMDKAMGLKGYEYFCEIHKNDPAMLRLYNSREKYQEWIELARAYKKEISKLSGKVISVPKKPTAQEVVKLLKNNPAVIISLRGGAAASSHLVVAYGQVDSSTLKVYYPQRFSGTLQEMSLGRINSQLAHGEPLIGVSK